MTHRFLKSGKSIVMKSVPIPDPSDKDELLQFIQHENPDFSKEKIARAIDRCSEIIPPPRNRSAFLQTINWYLKLI